MSTRWTPGLVESPTLAEFVEVDDPNSADRCTWLAYGEPGAVVFKVSANPFAACPARRS